MNISARRTIVSPNSFHQKSQEKIIITVYVWRFLKSYVFQQFDDRPYDKQIFKALRDLFWISTLQLLLAVFSETDNHVINQSLNIVYYSDPIENMWICFCSKCLILNTIPTILANKLRNWKRKSIFEIKTPFYKLYVIRNNMYIIKGQWI